MSLFPGEKVYDQSNFAELLGNGKFVMACGDKRLLSRLPPPNGHDRGAYSKPFSDSFQTIPRSEWPARIKEQLALKARVSDYEKWPALDQNGTGECWSNGPAGAAATARVIQGLPYVALSPASIAVPLNGGWDGGFEGDAVRYGTEHGWAPSSLWPQHSCDRSLLNDPKVKASRQFFMALEVYDLGNDYDKLGTALLLSMPCLAAFEDWGHVTEICDLVEIERGSMGHRIRNSWKDSWGSRNDNNVGGYATFREGGGPHCRPSGIFAIRQLTSHPGSEYTGEAA